MNDKRIIKKYMLVLQRKYVKEQEVFEFNNNGEGYTVPIISFTDIKKDAGKNNITQKQTLAFFDAITNKFVSLSSFLSVVGNTYKINPNNFKEETSFIGFLNKNRMNSVRISFGDEELSHIAIAASGNSINIHDEKTIVALNDIMTLIEDTNFISTLNGYYTNQDRKSQFNFSNKLVNDINEYHRNKINYDYSNLYRMRMDDDETYNLERTRKEVLNDLKSYKNFRELYRFRKWYIKIMKKTDNNLVIKEDDTACDNFHDYYEEVRQKSYPRPKEKSDDFPGQMSIFDLDVR